MTSIKVSSTSLTSADCTPILLRDRKTTRLFFRPMIVQNPRNSAAAVKGTFIYQRKGTDGKWEDVDKVSLSTLKKDEGYQLEIRSEEMLRLYKGVKDLYQLHKVEGVPLGDTEFVPITDSLRDLTQLPEDDLSRLLEANGSLGGEVLERLLRWASEPKELRHLVDQLTRLAPENLANLSAAVGLQRLRAALDLWREQQDSKDEEFWQETLAQNSFVLEHLFSWPTTVVKEKAYVGGKSVLNTGGGVVDFLLKNHVTNNAALVEIKTPGTPLLGREYRDGVYNPSTHLSGSALQVLNYRHSLQVEYTSLTSGQQDLFSAFEPQCVAIIGNAAGELDSREKVKSFELFRGQFSAVTIITFDELFVRIEKLIELLENTHLE